MITKTKQNWTIGQQVKVGFLKLTVLAAKDVKDGMPDIYLLTLNGKFYEFIPYNGLTRINDNQRKAWGI